MQQQTKKKQKTKKPKNQKLKNQKAKNKKKQTKNYDVWLLYPLFIHCINTQRGCHTLKLKLRINKLNREKVNK